MNMHAGYLCVHCSNQAIFSLFSVIFTLWASLVAQMVKNLPAMWETWAPSLGWEDPLEKGMATPTSILAWKIPWTEEPGRLQFMGVAKSQTRLNDFHFVYLTWWFWDLATLVHVSVAHFFYWSVVFHCLDRAHFVYAATLGDSRLAGSDGKVWVSLLNKLIKCSKADVPDDIPFSHVWDFQFLHILINTWCCWSSWF